MFKTLEGDIGDAREGLETCVREWLEYEESHKELCGWLEEMEEKMKNEVPLVDNLEEMSDQLQEYQVGD